jgi:hypothetical protein
MAVQRAKVDGSEIRRTEILLLQRSYRNLCRAWCSGAFNLMSRKQPETLFKEKFAKRLKEIPNSYWIKTQMRSVRGIPDYVGVVNGRCCALELKTDKSGSEVDSLQSWTLGKLKLCGSYIAIARPSNADEIIADLTVISKEFPWFKLD